MKNGVSGAPVPVDFPYSGIINTLGLQYDYPPCLIAAIKFNETGLGHDPTVVSGDGGHGLMQLTSSYPSDWANPTANFTYAIEHFLIPAWSDWVDTEEGDNLVRCVAATYNAGYGNAWAGHVEGSVDKYTTNNYGARALEAYTTLVGGGIPA
jgi:soluble lytic murein transglycosylase-like protein